MNIKKNEEVNLDEIESQKPFEEAKWVEVENPPHVPKDLIKTAKLKSLNYLTPFEIWNAIIGNPLWSIIVSETNKYSQRSLSQEKMQAHLEKHPFSRFHRWSETNPKEMMKFTAIMLSMAISKRNSIKGKLKILFF